MAYDESKGIGKPGKLEKHCSSKPHTAALTSFFSYSVTDGNVELMLSKKLKLREIQKQKDIIQNREVIKILLDVARTLARQGLAFGGGKKDENGNFMQLVNLMARHCPILMS